MKAMLFAAGLGTRLQPFTNEHPKALLPLAGKTLLQWQLERFCAADITDVVINVHHFPEQIADYLRAHHDFGCRIRLSEEPDLLETGGGLRRAASMLLDGAEEPVLVANVDVLSNIDLHTVEQVYNPADFAMLVVSERTTQRYLVFDDQLCLTGWRNLHTGEERGRTDGRMLAFSGMHVVSPRMLRYMQQSCPERFGITDFYLQECARESIRAYVPSDYRMMDVGKTEQLARAESFARELTHLS